MLLNKRIINLTMFCSSVEQTEIGVFDVSVIDRKKIKKALSFSNLPGKVDLENAADTFVEIASRYATKNIVMAMIDGPPYLTWRISKGLKEIGIIPVFSFFELSKEIVDEVEVSTMKHTGFLSM